MNQRWLIVFSQDAYNRELKTQAKSQAREKEAAEKQWRKVCQPVFNFQEDAEAACKQFNQRWKFHQASTEVIPITKHAHPGRPSAGAEPDVVRYALTGSVKAYTPGVEDAKRSLEPV